MLLKMFRFCLDAKSNFNSKVESFNLTFSQWQVLKVINCSDKGELMINEIVKELNSDKATVSLIVKKLKEKKMIDARPSSEDKRKMYISISPMMKAKCVELRNVEKEFTDELFSNLNKEEKKQLMKIFNKL